MYYITEKEVLENLTMEDAIEAMEVAFAEYSRGNAISDSRLRTRLSGTILNSMPAILEKYGIAGTKVYLATKDRAKFVVLIFSIESNELISVIEADRLGQMRTGALPAMVTRKIIMKNPEKIAIIGSGYQAETQLEGLLNIFVPESITVYSKNYKNAISFANRMSEKFGIDIRATESAREAVYGARVINTITNSNTPIFSIDDLSGEFHVNLAGANLPFRREVDKSVLENAEMIIVEHFEQAMKESLEIIDYVVSKGKEKIIELKDFMGLEAFEYKSKTVFKSMGIGLEDIAAGYTVMKNMGLV